MKGEAYKFSNDCPAPLPQHLSFDDIIALPRRRKPKVHHIYLKTLRIVAEIEPGVTFDWFTYNGTVPGPVIFFGKC